MTAVRRFTFYLVTNSVNGHRYVGVTVKTADARWREHILDSQRLVGKTAGKRHFPLQRAILKYGPEAFLVSAIEASTMTHPEAMAREISLIAELKPEYNATPGGQGNIGPRSRETREKIRAAVKALWANGHQGARGQHWSHPPEVREKQRVLGLKNREKWLEYSHLGPASQARPVVCLSDGNTYGSASEAARAYGVARSALIELCLGKNGRRSVGGLVFAYCE